VHGFACFRRRRGMVGGKAAGCCSGCEACVIAQHLHMAPLDDVIQEMCYSKIKLRKRPVSVIMVFFK
jgi:hypothetical protein